MIRLFADELACVRGGREIFQGLGFAVISGETLAITGPNGAGKSSLLRLIAGLIRPTRGEVFYQQRDDCQAPDLPVELPTIPPSAAD